MAGAGKSFSSSSSSWSRTSRISSPSSSSSSSSKSSSSGTWKSLSSATSSSNAGRSSLTSSVAPKSSSSSSGTGKSLSSAVSSSNASRSAWMSSISSSKWGSSSSGSSSSKSSSSSTGKSIWWSSSRSTTSRSNISSGRSSWWGGWGWSSSSSSSAKGKNFANAMSEIQKASSNPNASVSTDWSNVTITTKSDTNKLIPGTSIKTWGKTNYKTFNEEGDVIDDTDVMGKGYGIENMDEALYVGESDDDDDEVQINPYEDVMNWEWNLYTQEQLDEAINNALDEYDNENQYYRDDIYDQFDNYREDNSLKEEIEPEKSETEKRLETPAFNQYSWNSEVTAPVEAAAPSNIPNPNDPLTDPTSYNEPLTWAITRLANIMFKPQPQTDTGVAQTEAPEYNWDINQTLQWYNDAFNNIEAKGINRWTANEFANLYWKAKADIERYAEENWLSEEERLKLLAQLKNHPLVRNLNQNRWQWMR